MSKRTPQNCSLIKRGLREGIGLPQTDNDGKCMGYSHSEDDDEPCEICKECKWNMSFEE